MKKTNCYAYRCAFKFLLLMKLSIVLILFTYTSLWASDVSGQRINLDLKEAPIEKVLEAIREQGRYSFVYQSQIFPRDLKINIRTKNASIDSVMDKLLLNTPLYYKK
ncbi:STN domain-containing protein [Niabella hibiscisoli]|uniref:STN domain-containing protein n=1 Tax=Niabella hibiscisoli TaxID=1825928 RepID=UPI001F0F5F2B|nr:STN domain-containing protein [Niabella hibiscisoli]MCH5718241.1 STN domain-containing protein [Niabella hibiscisoli]